MPLPWQSPYYASITSPRSLPGLQLWNDAADTSSLVSGTGIKIWADKSGNSSASAFVSDGTASNTATSPNVSTTGSQTFSFDVLFPDYTPAGNITLVDKLSGFNGFQIILLTTGVIRFVCGNGTNTANVDSTTGLTLTDLSRGRFQVIWTDGVGASFTQNGVALGSAVASARTLTNAAVAITVATLTPGVIFSFTCSTYTFNPSVAAKGATSFVAPTTGETWTINTSGATGARISGARDLYQGTAAKQPILTIAAAGNYLTFDGSNDYLKAAAFSLSQPETVYFVGSQVSWTDSDIIFDGNSVTERMFLAQTAGGASPSITPYSGSFGANALTTWSLATPSVITSVFNGASGSLRRNRATALAESTGAQSANGFTLGAVYNATTFIANITAQEVLIYSGAHDATTQDRVIRYLARKWGIKV